MDNIQLVVVDENTLGYIDPQSPTYVSVLHCSGLRSGSSGGHFQSPFGILPHYQIRPATLQDFIDYNVSPFGYFEDEYLKQNYPNYSDKHKPLF